MKGGHNQTPLLTPHKSINEVLRELKEEGDDPTQQELGLGEEEFLLGQEFVIPDSQRSKVSFTHDADKTPEERLRRERQDFQSERIDNMDEEQYLSFHQCRLANFLSRGKHLLCDWLKLLVDSFEKKDLEIFSYVLRITL